MRSIKSISPFLLFSPFLLLYIVLVFIFPTNGTTGDESRYLTFGQNLLDGFYSPPAPRIDIGNGPGYPILIAPFLALGLPLISMTLVNAGLYYLSTIFLFKALQKVVAFPVAYACILFWACYYNSYENILLILPETFTAFLISLLVFSLLTAFELLNSKKTKIYIYLSGFIFGFIALTKVIFGYALACMLIGSVILWIMNKKNANYRKMFFILLIALTTTVPYLIYTHHLTGRIFYWSTYGGNNLYWMSTPFEREYGDWIRDPEPLSDSSQEDRKRIKGYERNVMANHGKYFEQIGNYENSVEKDDCFKRIAINNIKSHPVKFIKNCISNVGRMFFNYPYSYTLQKKPTLLRLPLSGILAVLMAYCSIPTFIKWKKITFPIRFVLCIALVYLGGSILCSAETRMLTVIVPVLLVWIAFVIQRTIRINLDW